MFDKRKHGTADDNSFNVPSPSSSSSGSYPDSLTSSLHEEPVHKKKFIALLKNIFALKFTHPTKTTKNRSTPDPRCRNPLPPNQQQYHQQIQRWSMDMVQEYLSSPPPPRKFTLRYPPPTCGTAFLTTIPEV